MTTEQKDIRSSYIALSNIYRASSGSVEFSSPQEEDHMYDAIVTTEDFKFAVVLRNSSFISSKAFTGFIESLKNDLLKQVPLPLLLVCVNEVQESVQVAFPYKRVASSIEVDERPRLLSLTKENWSRIIDSLKACLPLIMPLSKENRLVMRSITFSRSNEGRTSRARFVYFRDLDNEKYRMKEVSPNLSPKDRFERNLNGTPKEEYPSDTLDILIKSRFEEMFCDVSEDLSLFLFNSQLGNLQTVWRNASKADCDLIFKLQIDDVSYPELDSIKDVSSLCKHCKIYVLADQLHIFDSVTTIDIKKSLKDWINSYAIIKTQLQTMHSIDEVVG